MPEKARFSKLLNLPKGADVGKAINDAMKAIEDENYLSDLLDIKVDLVEKTTLKPAIGRHILEEVLPV